MIFIVHFRHITTFASTNECSLLAIKYKKTVRLRLGLGIGL